MGATDDQRVNVSSESVSFPPDDRVGPHESQRADDLRSTPDTRTPRVPVPPPERVTAACERLNQVGASYPAERAKLAGQLDGAWGQLVADNADLANLAVWARLATSVSLRGGRGPLEDCAYELGKVTAPNMSLSQEAQRRYSGAEVVVPQ